MRWSCPTPFLTTLFMHFSVKFVIMLMKIAKKIVPVVVLVVALTIKLTMLKCNNVSLLDSKGEQLSKDKVIVITGANSGLGYYTALALAGNGAKVVLACRSMERCNAAREAITVKHPQASVDSLTLDLSSFQSIRAFASQVKQKYETIDVLINNAGVMAMSTKQVTEDGLEVKYTTLYTILHYTTL